MPVESVTYVQDLNPLYPDGDGPRSQGDDHLRNIKKALRNSFPVDLRQLSGLSASDEGKIITVDSAGLLEASSVGETIETDAAYTLTTSPAALTFDTETSDDLNLWDGANPTRITMPSNNLILVCSFQAAYSGHDVGLDLVQINARINGVTNSFVSYIPYFLAAAGLPETFFFVTGLSTGDYFEMLLKQIQIDTTDTSIPLTDCKVSIRRFF